MDLISILLALLVFLVIAYVVKILADYCEVTPPIRNVVLLIVFLIFLIYVMRSMGIVRI